MKAQSRLLGMLLLLGAACSDSTPPANTIAFRFESATCEGTAVVDLFIDERQVGSPSLTAGVTSSSFEVSAGTHAVRAKSVETGTEWTDEEVTVAGPTIVSYVCSPTRRLAKFTATIQNRLEDAVVFILDGVVDTVAALASKDVKFSTVANFTWSPVPQRYSDGTPIPDDQLTSRDTLLNRKATPVTPFSTITGSPFFTFNFTNSSAVAVSVGVWSGSALRCLQNLPPPSARYVYGYFTMKPGVEVRAYGGPDCTGNFASWSYTEILKRNATTGQLALNLTTPP